MKQREVEVGGCYLVKVSGVLVPVRLAEESPFGGWVGVNMKTERRVRIRTAGKLRRPLSNDEVVALCN